MKIIIVNLRYFISGGPERYMFNIMDVLTSHGHEVIPFSVKHKLNKPSDYEPYFLEPIGKGEEVYFSEYRINNARDIIRLIGRLFYSFEAKRKLSSLIKLTKPDLVYVLYFENKLSPSVINAAKRAGIPVVVRISDFGMICATNLFYLTKRQELCEKCINKARHHLILNKCYHNSYFYSILKYLSYLLHDVIKVYDSVDAFVIPSNFTISKFVEYGIPKRKIFHIPTFFNFQNDTGLINYGNFALYIGRIDPDKGIKVLVDSFLNTGYQLKIIGFSSSGYEDYIVNYLSGKNHNISFLGRMDFNEIVPYLQNCCFTILPSECYDNFPNAILESFAYKKAVIATNIGSLKELVENEKTGLLFKHRDPIDLRAKVASLFEDKSKAKEYGECGFQKLNNEFSKETHFNALMNLFSSLLKSSNTK